MHPETSTEYRLNRNYLRAGQACKIDGVPGVFIFQHTEVSNTGETVGVFVGGKPPRGRYEAQILTRTFRMERVCHRYLEVPFWLQNALVETRAISAAAHRRVK